MENARCPDRIALGIWVLAVAVLTWSCSATENPGLSDPVTATTEPSVPTTAATTTTTTTTTTTAATTTSQLAVASEQTTLPLPQAVLAAWLVNSTGEVAAVISDGAAIPVNVQSTELVEIDGVNHVRVEATGIPDYVHDISSTDEFFLAGRPRADSDFRTGRPLVGVGSRVRFGQDIGYRSTGCDDRPGTGFGFWPPGPTCPTHQAWEALFPVESVEAAASEAQGLGSIGLWVNGVAVFGWGDGHSWLEQDVWHNLAPAAEIYDLDICPGHSAFGTYHHHSHPVCLAEAIGDTGENHSPVYGFAIDGAPIAGPWADTALLARSSWVTRDYDVPGSPTGCETPGTRSCLLVHQLDATAGVVATAWTGPSTSGTAQSLSGNTFVTSSGFYMEDWYYEPRLNDGSPAALDEHNGHVGRIPGFADALYHYHVAREVAADGSIVDVFPYYIGPTFYGVPSATGLGPGAGGPPNLAAAAAALGVSVAELAQALGPPPPNLPAAAQILGVSLAELEAAVGPP